MRPLGVLCSLVVISSTVGQVDPPTPGCAISCWENTKYVSKCLDDIACLCGEPVYQNSVYQCIYSQCDTVHFGSALHHTISQCIGTGNQMIFGVPPVPNQDSLRRREVEYLAGAKLFGSGGSAVPFPTESAPFPIQSAGASSPTATPPPYFPLNTATSPAPAPAALSEPAPIAVSTTPAPLLFTGVASHLEASILLGFLSVLAILYYAL